MTFLAIIDAVRQLNLVKNTIYLSYECNQANGRKNVLLPTIILILSRQTILTNHSTALFILVYPHFNAKRASQEQLKSPLKCFDCYAFVYCGSTLFHVKEGIT